MTTRVQDALIQGLFEGTISRETFIRRAAAAGLSASAVAAFLGTGHDVSASSTRQARPKALPRANADRSKTAIFDVDGGRQTGYNLFNPFVTGAPTSAGFQQAVIEPLFILNYGTGKIDPWLGESYMANKAQDVWTIRLRKGIKWSDGKDFNADDVVFTLDMLKTGPATLTWASAMQEWIKGVKKIDAHTVQISLTKPNPRFLLSYLTVGIYWSLYIMPEHIWKGKDPEKFQNYDPAKGWPVFTGPYKLKTATPTEFLYLRDPNWWGAKAGFKSLPAPEKLLWLANGTEDVRVALAANHGLDSIMDITAGGFQALKARNPNIIAWYPKPPYAWVDPCARQLSFNTAVAPWDDKDLRWAVSYAINRDQVVSIAYENTTTPGKFMFPAYPPLDRYVSLLQARGVFKKYPSGSYDPAMAKKLIESKGYTKGSSGYYEKNGKQLSLEILTSADFIELKRVAQVLVQQLQNVGINATMPILAGVTWGNNQNFGRYQAAMAWNSCGSVAEPWTSMDVYNIRWAVPIGKQASYNQFRWKNKKYSDLVDTLGTLPLNSPKGDDLFVEAATIWLSELPAIPVTQAKKLVPFDTTYWTGWPTAANYYNHPATWWGSTHEIIHRLKPTGR